MAADVNRRPLLLLLLLLAPLGCSNTAPYVSSVGILRPGAMLTVRVTQAQVQAYQPEVKQRRDLFTIAATALPKGTPPPAPRMRAKANGLAVDAPNALADLLVRVPDRVDLRVVSQSGDVNVTDITGNADVVAGHGNVTVELPGYAQASAARGNVQVTMGSTNWPGTLHFSSGHGDVELRINPNVPCNIRLHTDNGVLFTDFALRGTSTGRSETIDAPLNGGGSRGIDIEVVSGSIRLLRMQPQP